MSRTSARTVSARQLALIYMATFMGAMLFHYLISLVFQAVLAISIGSMLAPVLIIFVSGCFVGHFWYSRELARPTSSRKWKIAILCATTNFVFYGLSICVAYYILDMQLLFAVAFLPLEIWAVLLIGWIVASVIVIRLGLDAGFRIAAK